MAVNEKDLFRLCDRVYDCIQAEINKNQLFRHNRGWLDIDDLRLASPQLSSDEISYIFEQLDKDRDGRIIEQDFVSGFVQVINECERNGYQGVRRRASVALKVPPCVGKAPGKSGSKSAAQSGSEIRSRLGSWRHNKSYSGEAIGESGSGSVPGSADELAKLPCQEDVLTLYERLQVAGTPELLAQFEKVIGGFVKEIGDQREQNERLQKIYERERDTHSKTLSEVEYELDRQLEAAEQKARTEERARLEKEKATIRVSLESEIQELRSNIQRLQKMENTLNENSKKSDKMSEVHNKLQDITMENRNLKSNLTENQVEMALIRSELACLRQEYDDKCRMLMNEKDRLLSYMHEQDTMARQLQLLYEANKKLHDTNDNLRAALEDRTQTFRQLNIRTPSPIGPVQQQARTPLPPGSLPMPHRAVDLRYAAHGRHLSAQNVMHMDDDLDSGLARASDLSDHSTDNEARRCVSMSVPAAGCNTPAELLSATEEEDPPTKPSSDPPPNTPCDQSPAKSAVSSEGAASCLLSPATGAPERTFRVVMAGDASVGKSSLVMRLTRGKWVAGLPSTLGVDFHVKSLCVQGKNVAVQLWDTAGQERFRSMSKSYFRRADGALLLFDCTSEMSFLNVRNWIDTIQESASKRIPIFMVCNKVDMRVAAAADGKRVVQTDDGQKLAKSYEAHYVEASAKTGHNVDELMLQLVKELMSREDSDMMSNSVVLGKAQGNNTASTSRCMNGQRRCT